MIGFFHVGWQEPSCRGETHESSHMNDISDTPCITESNI